jgi:hypothetical protein
MASKMNWKLWAKKVGIVFVAGGVVSLISLLESVPVDASQAIYVTTALAILQGINNYLKHRK